MKPPDDLLMAYADGELDPKTRAEVEAAIAADPEAGRFVAAHRALRARLRSSFDTVLEEPIPDRLITAARTRRLKPRPPPSRRPSLPYWSAIAASFVLGAVVWHFGADYFTSGPITEKGGQLLASGTLEQALSNQLVKDQSVQAAVQIGVSFRSRSGSYCRTFQVSQQTTLAGLACRQGGRWQLNALARGEAAGQASSQLRPAGSAVPASILQAVEQAIDGEPLDAEAEARARTNQWRVPQ